jgi:hypothetical protein
MNFKYNTKNQDVDGHGCNAHNKKNKGALNHQTRRSPAATHLQLRAAPRRAPSPAHTDAPRFLSTNILKPFVSIRESRKGCGQALSQRPLTPVASEALSPQEEKKKKKKKKKKKQGDVPPFRERDPRAWTCPLALVAPGAWPRPVQDPRASRGTVTRVENSANTNGVSSGGGELSGSAGLCSNASCQGADD